MSIYTTGSAAVGLTMLATSAFGGCFGMEREPGLSDITNVQLAGLAAMQLHARNSTYNDVQYYRTREFNLSNGQTIEVEGNFSGHSYASAVRRCENYHGGTKEYPRHGSITSDFSALTCNGRQAYVATPDGSVYVVERGSVPAPVFGPIQCRR